MTEIRHPAQQQSGTTVPQERVWVLDDPRAGTSAQAIGIAERLGVAFRRIPLAWNWMAHVGGLARHGSLIGLAEPARRTVGLGLTGLSLPESLGGAIAGGAMTGGPATGVGTSGSAGGRAPGLVISAGRRSAAVALWLKARYGCRIVHCMSPGMGGVLRADAFDLLVIPTHDRPPAAHNVLPVLGAPHRLSPLVMGQAAAAWDDRLGHLPFPRVALLVGGPVRGSELPPAMAHALGRQVARLTAARGGSVLATTSRRTGAEATEALAAGLSPALHLLYRWGEPGPNPYAGFLATASTIIVTADSVSMISEACGTTAPVYLALPELAGPRHRRMMASLAEAGHVRRLVDDLSPWPRQILDEAGRVASEIRRRFPLD